jgi:phytanoyl-CoA hydroxylase
MVDVIRRFKLAYSVYNFFHRKELRHNETLYKSLGLNKKYYSSVSSRDFAPFEKEHAIVIHPEKIQASSIYSTISDNSRQSLLDFDKNGFAVIESFLSPGKTDAVNAEVEKLVNDGTVKYTNRNKLMFAIHHSGLLWDIGNDAKLVDVLSVLLDGKAILFQSINFLTGSEQATHSDSIHMTTYPLGGLLGVWIAMEDITEENGPLHYYPGSHKLPYYLNADYNNEGSTFMIGDKSYTAYENMMQQKIKERGLKKEIFKAKKGDLLIWHANLFHGGEPHTNKNMSRKSMVLHYFKENSICYHEITQRPALIKNFD